MLKDEDIISELSLTSSKLYFKDLGPQVGWTTVSTWGLMLHHYMCQMETGASV